MVTNPLNIAHVQIQSGASTAGFLGTILGLYRANGIRGLYVGIGPSLVLTCVRTTRKTSDERVISSKHRFMILLECFFVLNLRVFSRPRP